MSRTIRLRCISVRQPWAELIAAGIKQVENRTWRTDYTGPLGIHASRSKDTLNDMTDEEMKEWFPDWPHHTFDFGSVIAVVRLEQCCRFDDLPDELRDHEFASDDDDNWCWVLRDPVRLLTPVPATGQAQFFYVNVPESAPPPALLTELQNQAAN